MPYEFRGENLVYVEPPEVTGYTWSSIGGGADTAPEERWVKNPDFDLSSILDTKTDKYGREVSTLKEDATEADKRAYNLSRNYDPSDWQVKTEMQTGANPDWVNNMNKGWWDVDPAIQEQWQAANRATSGNAVGMSGFKDWIVPLSILAAGAGTAIGTGALAGGAAAGEAGGLTGLSQALPYTEAFDAANLASQGLNSAAIGQNLAATGLDSFLAADMANLAAQGLSESQIASTLAASYSPAELAGTGIESLNWGNTAASSLNPSDLLKAANTAKSALGVAGTAAKLLSGSGATKTGTTGGVDLSKLANLLRPTSTGPTSFGQIKMNQNPFTWSTPGQTVASEGMYDVSGSNPMANALRKA